MVSMIFYWVGTIVCVGIISFILFILFLVFCQAINAFRFVYRWVKVAPLDSPMYTSHFKVYCRLWWWGFSDPPKYVIRYNKGIVYYPGKKKSDFPELNENLSDEDEEEI